MKPTIQLYDTVGTGIIICCESGVLVSNQTGGTSCLHLEVEGIFIPVRNEYMLPDRVFESPELELSSYFCGPKHRGAGATSGLDIADGFDDYHRVNSPKGSPLADCRTWQLKALRIGCDFRFMLATIESRITD